MADQRSLSRIGYIFGGITAAVMMIACLVVTGHVSGHSTMDAGYYASAER